MPPQQDEAKLAFTPDQLDAAGVIYQESEGTKFIEINAKAQGHLIALAPVGTTPNEILQAVIVAYGIEGDASINTNPVSQTLLIWQTKGKGVAAPEAASVPVPNSSASGLTIEEWRPVVGAGVNSGFEVSSIGRVRTPHGVKRCWLNRQTGYLTVRLALPDGPKHNLYYVHALVASAFLGPRPPGAEIDHADQRRDNNNVSNLRYVSQEENRAQGGINRRSLSDDEVLNIYRRAWLGEDQAQIATEFGITQPQVSYIKLGKQYWYVTKHDRAPMRRAS